MQVYNEDGCASTAHDDDDDFRPSKVDTQEAAELFADDDDQTEDWEEFGRWLDTLPNDRFRSVSRAIDLVRDALIDWRSESSLGAFMGWLD